MPHEPLRPFASMAITSLLLLASACSLEPQATEPVRNTKSAPPTLPPTATLAGETAPVPSNQAPPPTTPHATCREQAAQDFLVRAHENTVFRDPEARKEQRRLRAESIAYRTRHYGYFKGFGSSALNGQSPAQRSAPTQFFGITVVLNRAIIPALHCVEAAIEEHCSSTPYRPQILSGLRKKNTYFDGGVSNHVYGIAIDVDPTRNPCCNCVAPWNESELCKSRKSVWERMSMPRCWVTQFERFGFYWLGHDPLEDTMHFEFLGDPERVTSG